MKFFRILLIILFTSVCFNSNAQSSIIQKRIANDAVTASRNWSAGTYIFVESSNTWNILASTWTQGTAFSAADFTLVTNPLSTAQVDDISQSFQGASISGNVITLTRADNTTVTITVSSTLRPLVPDPAGGAILELRPDSEDVDASLGLFPSGAMAGYTYIVSVAGTIDGVQFNVNDLIVALIDGASTGTFANNWHKVEGGVHSFGGLTGVIDDRAINTKLTSLGYTNTPRTDEQVRDITAAQLVAGSGINIVEDDINNTITISVGGATPTPSNDDQFRYGFLGSADDPLTADITGFNQVINPTNPTNITTGAAPADSKFTMYVDSRHDISTITDVLGTDVLSLFTKSGSQRTISGQTHFVYQTTATLNSGINQTFTLNFQ